MLVGQRRQPVIGAEDIARAVDEIEMVGIVAGGLAATRAPSDKLVCAVPAVARAVAVARSAIAPARRCVGDDRARRPPASAPGASRIGLRRVADHHRDRIAPAVGRGQHADIVIARGAPARDPGRCRSCAPNLPAVGQRPCSRAQPVLHDRPSSPSSHCGRGAATAIRRASAAPAHRRSRSGWRRRADRRHRRSNAAVAHASGQRARAHR